jgi:hypothetical protein
MSIHYVIINKKQLTALSLAMSKEEARYYLKGVCFQLIEDRSDDHENNYVLATATDGHVLVNIKLASYIHAYGGVQFIAPSGFIKHALKLMKAKGDYVIVYNDKKQEIGLSDPQGATMPIAKQITAWNPAERKHVVMREEYYKAIDGTYPDYVRLILKSDVFPEDNELTYAYSTERKRIVRILDLLGDDRDTLSFRSTGFGNNAVYRSPVELSVSYTILLSALRKPWVGEISEKDSRVCVNLNTGEPYTEN